MRQIAQVTVVGTGLLGGSIGLGLKAAGYGGRIVGVGRRAVTIERAVALGCVDTATTDLAEALAGEADESGGLVVLATPLGTFQAVFERLAALGRPGMIVTDVGSTKQQVCAAAERLLPDGSRFVGAHPMAGSEQHGPDQAEAGLFEGKPCIITVGPDTDTEAVAAVEALWRTLGMHLVRMTAAEHDRKAAAVSHLPHAVATLIVALAGRADGLEIASTGFRDCTRVASGDPRVWIDIFTTNRRPVLEAVHDLGDDLARFGQMLENDDRAGLLALLTHSKLTRDEWGTASGSHHGRKGADSDAL